MGNGKRPKRSSCVPPDASVSPPPPPSAAAWRAALEGLRAGPVLIHERRADGSLGKLLYDSEAKK